MKNIIAVFLLSWLICSVGCKTEEGHHTHNISESKEPEVKEGFVNLSRVQFENSGFIMDTLKKMSFSDDLNVTGDIHLPARNKADITSLIGGTVGPISIIGGQWVRQGAVLFTLTNPELLHLQEEFLIKKRKFDYQNIELERLKNLTAEKVTSAKSLLKAESEFDILKTQISALSQRLVLYGIDPNTINPDGLSSTIPVTAPISGYISDISIVRGQYLEAGRTALQLYNNFHIHLELRVLERDISKIRVGQRVRFRIQDDNSEEYEGEVYLIDAKLDDNHFINIHCHIESGDKKMLKPGMYATAMIELDNYVSWALPEQAVVEQDGQSFILIFIDEEEGELQFRKYEVHIGKRQDEWVQIMNTDEILPDVQMIVNGGFQIMGESGGGHDH